MASIEEQVLRSAKEIVVKFIETGRVSPAGFPDIFKSVYRAIDATVKDAAVVPVEDAAQPESSEASKKKSRKGKTPKG